jgi:hypothetical protein
MISDQFEKVKGQNWSHNQWSGWSQKPKDPFKLFEINLMTVDSF